MQRKSIYEPKKSRELDPRQSRVPAPEPIPRSRPYANPLPPTQVVDRDHVKTSTYVQDAPVQAQTHMPTKEFIEPAPRSASKAYTRADPLPATQIVSKRNAKLPTFEAHNPVQMTAPASGSKAGATASGIKSRSRKQAKQLPTNFASSKPPTGNKEHSEDATLITPGVEHPERLMITLPTQKRKLDTEKPRPRQTRSQAKKSQDTQIVQRSAAATEIPDAKEHSAKRRKLNNTKAPQRAQLGSGVTNKYTPVSSNAANLVNTSPRKAAMMTHSERCSSCREAHTSCDKAHPVCGNCQKRLQRGPCVYTDAPVSQAQPATQMSAGPKEKVAAKPGALSKIESPMKFRGQSGFQHNDNLASSEAGRSSSPVRSPKGREKPKKPVGRSQMQQNGSRSSSKTLAGPNSTPASTVPNPSSARSIMPSFDDYMDLL